MQFDAVEAVFVDFWSVSSGQSNFMRMGVLEEQDGVVSW